MALTFTYPLYLWLLLLIPLTLALGWVGRRGMGRVRLWGGLALRTILLLAIIAALAGIQLRLPSNLLTTVFVLDASDSMTPAARSHAESVIREAVQAKRDSDQAAIVVFGEDALVERLASELANVAEISSTPITTRTDIASALQLAQALLPAEGARRIVLFSDGQENLGQAVDQAALLAQGEIELRYIAYDQPSGQAEALVKSLSSPAETRLGQTIPLTAIVHSSAELPATLRLFADNSLLQTQNVQLQVGDNTFTFDVPTQEGDPTGFRRFRLQVIPDQDTRLQNNEASTFTVVIGPPTILMVEGQPDDGSDLAAALQAAGMKLTRIAPSALPTTLPELAAYQSIILVNVHAAALPAGAMEALPVYVRDLGMGLIMIGGQQSFGAGGYLRSALEKALPVDMDVRDKELEANLALVLAVDKSGSMGRCHCDNPDLNQSYTPAFSGQPKVDIAKEAIMRASAALSDQDYLGVVAFDSQPRWVLELAKLHDPASLEGAISSFTADGQTNLEAGVAEAYKALQGVSARRKHIILMTDGWVQSGDLTTLANNMAKEGITLSVVAAGEGSAEYLLALAQVGGGTFYPATDIFNVPDIFLKETVKSIGEYIIEEPFYPLPSAPGVILTGLDETRLPLLLGYNGTTPKNTARLELLTTRGDPLLATWQYGLGRSAVWTSDLRGQWGKEWVSWPGFARFAAQLVNWTLPAPKTPGLEAQARLENGQLVVGLQAVDPAGQPLNFLTGQATLIDPDLQAQQIPLEQVGAGQYRAAADISQPGAYLIRLGVNQNDQSLGQVTLGAVAPYSPEYAETGADVGLLARLAELTAGGPLAEPAAAFAHTLTAQAQARDIWVPLLLLAALLFPIDVALRRLVFSQREWQRLQAWLDERLLQPLLNVLQPGRQARGEQPRALGRLFDARQRARHRQGEAPTGAEPPKDKLDLPAEYPKRPAQPQAAPPPPPEAPPPAAPPEDAPQDSLARLREAKKRAGKK